MGDGRIEWAEHLVEVWNAAEFETWLDEVGPEFAFTPDPSFPDAGTYRGEEFRSWMRGWISTWKENRFELLGVEEIAGARCSGAAGTWRLGRPAGRSPCRTSRWSSSMRTRVPSVRTGWPPASIHSWPVRRPKRALADSPVNRCMLMSTRLGCLKKPTEEARGG
jgi:hypothetical protein